MIRAADSLRPDLQLIAEMITPRTRVLDIGCGDGALLDYLVHEKQVDGRGMELSQDGVNVCVRHGLSVIQGDADTDLADYPPDAFDFVVLSETLQATHAPMTLLQQLVRIGHHAIVSFTNFGQWRNRWRFLASGRMPVIDGPQTRWYDTPNIHLCTIRDFAELCQDLDLVVDRAVSLDRRGRARELANTGTLANLRADQAIFCLSRR